MGKFLRVLVVFFLLFSAAALTLGVMLFLSLTKRHPFEGTAVEIRHQQERARQDAALLPRPSEYVEGAPPAYDYGLLFGIPMWIALGCLAALLVFYPARPRAAVEPAA